MRQGGTGGDLLLELDEELGGELFLAMKLLFFALSC
jgi:hypothetical protein